MRKNLSLCIMAPISRFCLVHFSTGASLRNPAEKLEPCNFNGLRLPVFGTGLVYSPNVNAERMRWQ